MYECTEQYTHTTEAKGCVSCNLKFHASERSSTECCCLMIAPIRETLLQQLTQPFASVVCVYSVLGRRPQRVKYSMATLTSFVVRVFVITYLFDTSHWYGANVLKHRGRLQVRVVRNCMQKKFKN